MKKFLAFGLALALALQVSAAFAQTTAGATATPPGMEPTISTLFAFNTWLYGNNFYGTSYINNNLSATVALADKWDPKATLMSADVTFQQPSLINCSFVFGSLNQPNQVYKTDCVDLSSQQVQGQAVAATQATTAQTLFSAPTMKLRKFVSDIIAANTIMNQIRTYMGGSSEANVEFTLSMVNGQLTWNWGISDGKQKGASITADASQLNSTLNFTQQGS